MRRQWLCDGMPFTVQQSVSCSMLHANMYVSTALRCFSALRTALTTPVDDDADNIIQYNMMYTII